MYYGAFDKAKEIALNNGMPYHLAAILVRRKHIVRIGTNQQKTHPKFVRTYNNGDQCGTLHAEMDVLRFARPGDKIVVLRFSAEGELTMAKPCRWCKKHIEECNIERVIYSDWNGELKHFKVAV